MRILLVEDHPLIGEALRVGLSDAGFTVDWLRDGVAARQALKSEDFAATVLDLGLPRLSGLDLLQEIRSENNQIPVLILTARATVPDKLAGLNQGADDYLTKPVEIVELVARLRALIRRSHGRSSPRLRAGRVEMDPAERRVWLDGARVELLAREFTILEMLLESAGRAISRAQLEAVIYGFSDGAESNTVEVQIHRLRKKLGYDFIRTVRGVGYRVEVRADLA